VPNITSTCSVQYLEVPLLPQHGSPPGSHSAPPVTLEQLQLVTRALSATMGPGLSTASLLQALLLQRAAPGLRAQFLSSPAGSLWLDTLVSAPEKDRRCRGSPGWRCSAHLSVSTAKAELLAAVQGVNQGVQWFVVPAATASLLSLAWAHLEVVAGGPSNASAEYRLFASYRAGANPTAALKEPRGEC
jgi:hypothetical protein